MASYMPDGDPLCFTISTILHNRNQIDTDEYLDRMLAHLSGSRHPEDTPTLRIRYDPLSMAIQSCLFDEDFSPIQDTTPIKLLLTNCWNGSLDYVKQHTQRVLRLPELGGLARHILMAMICISCVRQDTGLADYSVSLIEDPPSFVSSMGRTIWKAGWTHPNPEIWSRLFDLGWASTLNSHSENMSVLASQTFIPGVPQADLLEVLFKHGLILSDELLWESAANMDANTMRYLVSKFDVSQMNSSCALAVAAAANTRVLDILLDSGMDINWMHDNMMMKDPRDGHDGIFHTALHTAARRGNRESVTLLLQRGANRDIKDTRGRTAAERAVQYGHNDIAELIETFTPRV